MSRYTVQYGTLADSGFQPLVNCLASFPIYAEDHRADLVQKIYNRYRFREIGFETPAMFVHYLNATLTEIMPIYNELYKSATQEFDLLDDVNYFEETTAQSQSNSSSDSADSGTTSDSGSASRAHSDTPQGSFNFTSVTANEYLSDADLTQSSGSGSHSDESHSVGSASSQGTGAKHVHGKMGGKSYGEMIKEFRAAIINIDKMILDELATCFMGVY